MAIDTHELAWAAGFFDGEGTVTCSRTNVRRNAQIQLLLPQSGDPELLYRFHAAVGFVGKVNGPWVAKCNGVEKQPRWALQAYGLGRVQEIIGMLWPWLGEAKKRQYNECIERWAADQRPTRLAKGGERP